MNQLDRMKERSQKAVEDREEKLWRKENAGELLFIQYLIKHYRDQDRKRYELLRKNAEESSQEAGEERAEG